MIIHTSHHSDTRPMRDVTFSMCASQLRSLKISSIRIFFSSSFIRFLFRCYLYIFIRKQYPRCEMQTLIHLNNNNNKKKCDFFLLLEFYCCCFCFSSSKFRDRWPVHKQHIFSIKKKIETDQNAMFS